MFLQHIMINSLMLRKEQKQKITKFIIKDVRNRFRLKTEANENTIKDIRNLFRPKKKKKINKKRKRGLFLFEQEKECK